MKLIKLNTELFVIVDESEIKDGDWVLMPNKTIHRMTSTDMIDYLNSESNSTKKITHSSLIMNNAITPLPMFIIEELIDEEGLNSIIDRIDDKLIRFSTEESKSWGIWKTGVSDGYKQCIEDNKDKILTESQIRILVDSVTEFMSHNEPNQFDSWFEKKLSTYKPKTEWEVEFDENNSLKLK